MYVCNVLFRTKCVCDRNSPAASPTRRLAETIKTLASSDPVNSWSSASEWKYPNSWKTGIVQSSYNWTWWYHDIDTLSLSALLTLSGGNPLVTSEFPSQRSSNTDLCRFSLVLVLTNNGIVDDLWRHVLDLWRHVPNWRHCQMRQYIFEKGKCSITQELCTCGSRYSVFYRIVVSSALFYPYSSWLLYCRLGDCPNVRKATLKTV